MQIHSRTEQPQETPEVLFQVKLWYASGSMETVSNVDFLAARSIYSEGVASERVCAGEVHLQSTGQVVAGFSGQEGDHHRAFSGGRLSATPVDGMGTAG